LLAPRPTPKLEDHPVSAVRDCLFNIFAATLLTGGRSSTFLYFPQNRRSRRVGISGAKLDQQHFSRFQIKKLCNINIGFL